MVQRRTNHQFRLESLEMQLQASTLRTRKALCPGKAIPIVKVIKIPFPPQIRLFHLLEQFSASFEWLASVDLESLFAKRACLESNPRVHEGSLPVQRCASRWQRSTRAVPTTPFCARPAVGSCSCCCQRLLLHRSPRGARFRKHSCNVGWKHSRVESGHLFWPANERVQPVELRPLRERRPSP